MYPSTFEGKNDKGEALAGTVKSYDTSNWKGQTYLVSWYGRANYSLLDRYLLTFTARYDGSSRFADGHRWGFFPSAAFAWRVKEESFLRDVKAVSDLKLRLGWGKTGQQDTGKEYSQLLTRRAPAITTSILSVAVTTQVCSIARWLTMTI